MKFIDAEGNIAPPVIACLNLAGIYVKNQGPDEGAQPSKPVLTINSRNLEDVVQALQGRINPTVSWMMKEKIWDMSNPLLTPKTAREILRIGSEDFKFHEPVYPHRKDYQGLLILGGEAARFQERVIFADTLLQKGITFNKVYILTGQRPLEKFEKEQFPSLKNIQDEGAMTLDFFKKSFNVKLQEKCIYVYSKAPFGSYRATTESTVHEFMKHNPEPGPYLAVSNSYYIPYQELVIQNCLEKNYPHAGIQVECVGNGDTTLLDKADDGVLVNKASILLDHLSRILYNLLQMKKNKVVA